MSPFADTTTWIAMGFAVGAAGLALAASVALVVLVLRRGRTDAAGADGAGARALDDARAESRRTRRLVDIASTIDLDAVLERTLVAASESTGVEAAMAVLHRAGDEPLVATIGLTAEEAARQPVSTPPAASARAVRIGYRYGTEIPGDGAERLIRGGVAVPVRDGEDVLGTLALFWRGSETRAEDEDVARLEELAAGAAPAIRNAQLFHEARRLADLDALTSLHNRRFFHEALGRECARADRYQRQLALIVLDLDDFKEINDRIGHLAGDAVLAEVGRRVRGVVRRTDVACRIGGDELAVVMPEASERDAEQLFRRIQLATAAGIGRSRERVRLSAGIAALHREDDAIALFERADEALYRAKRAGKNSVLKAESPGGQPEGG